MELKNAQMAAFGATRLPRRGVDDDANLAALLEAETPIVTLVGKSWTLHVDEALRTTREENLAMVRESVAYMAAAGRRVVFDAEHFFDGYQADRGYALAVLAAAIEGGADTLALCDTNGGTLPDDVVTIMTEVGPPVTADCAAAGLAPVRIGGHFHNDSACAVANSLVSVAAGGLHVQGAANGYGERCGNADLFSVIAGLELKRGHELLPPGRLGALASTARTIAEVANLPFEARQPYVGGSAFATKAGLHASAIARRPDAYSHIEPAAVGNQAQVLVSELAGRSNVLAKAAELGLDLDAGLAGRVLDQVKEAEHRGYAYEAADASFELLVRRSAGMLPTWFQLEGYRVVIERGGRLGGGPQRGHRPAAAGRGPGGGRRRGRRPGARAGPGAAPRPGRGVPGAGRHPPGRLQGAHPGRPGRHPRGDQGHADLGRPRRGVDHGRGVRRHRHGVLGGAGRRRGLRPAPRGRGGHPRRSAEPGRPNGCRRPV